MNLGYPFFCKAIKINNVIHITGIAYPSPMYRKANMLPIVQNAMIMMQTVIISSFICTGFFIWLCS